MTSACILTQTFLLNRFWKKVQAGKHDDLALRTLFTNEKKLAIATQIVSELVNMGLVEYIAGITKLGDAEYNERKIVTHSLIENIIKKYPRQFEQLTSSGNSDYNKINPFQHKIFTQPDMFSNILQFLDLFSLIKCSSVDSNWLVNSFTPKCIPAISVRFLEQEARPRDWERFKNGKHIEINIDNPRKHFMSRIINFLSLCSIIETLEITIDTYKDNQVIQLIECLNKIGSKLKSFSFLAMESDPSEWNIVDISQDTSTTKWQLKQYTSLKPLYLMNCENVMIDGVLFPVIVTNKCKRLWLWRECLLDYQSDNFDLSGVEYISLSNLELIDVNTVKGNNYQTMKEQDIFKMVNSKGLYKNVDELQVGCWRNDSSMNYLWSAIHLAWKKHIGGINSDGEFQKMRTTADIDCNNHLITCITRHKLTFTKLIIKEDIDFNSNEDEFKRLFDYVLNMKNSNDNNDKNKVEYLCLKMASKLGYERFEIFINGFTQLYKTDKEQYERFINGLKLIRIIQNTASNVNLKRLKAIGIEQVVRLIPIMEQMNKIKLDSNYSYSYSYNCTSSNQVLPMCALSLAIKLSSDSLTNHELMRLFIKTMKKMMIKQIAIDIILEWDHNYSQQATICKEKVFDTIFDHDVSDDETYTPKWYKLPICHDEYCQARKIPQINMTVVDASITLSNFTIG